MQNGLVAENHNFVSQIQAAIVKDFGPEAQGSHTHLDSYPRQKDSVVERGGETDEGRFLLLLDEVKSARGIQVMIALRALGIAHTKDTPVGDSTIR